MIILPTEIYNVRLDQKTKIKIFLISLIIIPISMVTHLCISIVGLFSIPNRTIDIITLSEKTKRAIKRKL